MIRLHLIAPENETAVAERLVAMIGKAWPDVAASASEHIDILVGVRVGMDVDILVIVDLHKPRRFEPQRRRDGSFGPAGSVQHALVSIEVKQVDVRDFRRVGNQLFPSYSGKESHRTVTRQAKDATIGLIDFAKRYVVSMPYVYALGWLTEVDDKTLVEIDSCNLGESATWATMLDACVQEHLSIVSPMPPNVARALGVIRNALTNRRLDSQRDVSRVESLAAETASPIVGRLLAEVGHKQVQITGRGGSGKTTTLALLAVRLAENGERVLILTFHKTLRSDISHLIESLAERAGVDTSCLHVDTTMNFLVAALEAWGVALPLKVDGINLDWSRLDETLDETRALLAGDPHDSNSDASKLRAAYPKRFGWDYVLVDESQDWHDAERDFLRLMYGHRRLVLSDGRDQLVRRRVACNWVAGVASAERTSVSLEASLRMLRNIALFGNAVARAIGFNSWHIMPHEKLSGGRVIILAGAFIDSAMLRHIVLAAKDDKADASDCLICLPARSRNHGDERRLTLIDSALEAGVELWDGTLPENRDIAPATVDAMRMVRYDSCRGLEGWTSVIVDLDELVRQKIEHPNAHPSDPEIDARRAAMRWILIPLTRAVHTLVITLRDPDAEVAGILRTAMRDPSIPPGTVMWTNSPAEAAAVLKRNR